MVSSLINGNAKLPFHNYQTFVECVEKKKCEFISDNESISNSHIQQILKSNNSFDQRLKDSIDVKNIFIHSVDEVLNKIVQEREKYIVTLMYKYRYLSLTNSNNRCLYSTVVQSMEFLTFPIAKNSLIKTKLNLFGQHTMETNLLEKLISKYLRPEQICEPDIIRQNLEPISIFGIVGIVFRLLIGFLIGFLAFMLEKLYFFFSFRKLFVV